MRSDCPSNADPSGPGTVYLVGAGPGDPGLLTLRGAELLRKAEVVVHDALVGEGILALIPPGARRVDVGKRGGGRNTSQRLIHRILVEAARQARVVVRLKGGDPFVFGRGGEEILALREAGIPFEVVPGITAATGAAAALGVPLTHRGTASCVTFATGHGAGGGERWGPEEWRALAVLQGTLVLYMGMAHLAAAAAALMEGGRSPDTPVVVVEWATLPRQRQVEGTLAGIARAVDQAGLGAPAVVVVGEVAGLAAAPAGIGAAGGEAGTGPAALWGEPVPLPLRAVGVP